MGFTPEQFMKAATDEARRMMADLIAKAADWQVRITPQVRQGPRTFSSRSTTLRYCSASRTAWSWASVGSAQGRERKVLVIRVEAPDFEALIGNLKAAGYPILAATR